MPIPWKVDLMESPEEFSAWKRLWQSMPHRKVEDVAKIDVHRYLGYDFGKLISATISLAPEQFIEGIYFPVNECPICLLTTTPDDSIAASLNPTFEQTQGLGVFVWVHSECFETLTLSYEPTTFPALSL